ncbi:MAG: response regulator [Bacteroidales bacterium]|nr:response regulator [Bacteroidales bacterium]
MKPEPDQKEKFLYVDDLKENLLLFQATFESDFEITVAKSGQKALELLNENDFAGIIADQNMPGMTGIELLETASEKYPEMLRFIITAYIDFDNVVESINRGLVDGYFAKPYNNDEIRSIIFKALEVRNLRGKNQEMLMNLERVNAELLELERSKIDFLSSFTDEIRNPINKVMTAVHVIKDRVDSRELIESMHLLDISLGRLDNFTQAVKLLLRLQDTDAKINITGVSLKEIIEIGILEEENVLKYKGLDYFVREGSPDVTIEGEFELILTCFTILIELVEKHAEADSEVAFFASNDDGKLTLGIDCSKSNFSGGDKKLLTKLFSEEKVSISKDYSVELYLTHYIMSLHKGNIEITFNEDLSTNIRMLFPVPGVLSNDGNN